MSHKILIKNILSINNFFTICKKVRTRVFDKKSSVSETELLSWFEKNQTDMEVYCKSINEKLWMESVEECGRIKEKSKNILSQIPFNLGGGGAYPLLYFFVRHRRPKVVVETGVAAGFSSYAVLNALDKNEHGNLYSSDFPYFRIPSPEKYVGILVPEHLRHRWFLYIKGDEANFPLIMRGINHIDILHYDSDKSYSGRSYALSKLINLIDNNTLIIFDDIQDNSHFFDLVSKVDKKNWKVFKFENKWLGVICNWKN